MIACRAPSPLIRWLLLSMAFVAAGRLAAEDLPPLSEEEAFTSFQKQVFPLLTRDNGGCLECHDTPATSPLVLSGDAQSDFRRLLDEQYLRGSEGDTLLGRLVTANKELRMPKGSEPWTEDELERLRSFLRRVDPLVANRGSEEGFPRALLTPYLSDAPTTADNRFITFRQLRGKIATIFEDHWIRAGRDLFAENVSLFGGADFKTRFNESPTPRASFLTGMEMLSRDVAERAYQDRQGPFRDWPQAFRSPLELDSPDAAFVTAIQQLYRQILFRSATPLELEQAFHLIQQVHALEETISLRDSELEFELVARDPELQMESRTTIRIPVSGERLEVSQRMVDQSQLASDADDPYTEELLGEFRLSPQGSGQRLVLHNLGTHRNVSFAGVVLRNLDADSSIELPADSSQVQVEGAWESEERNGLTSYEDRSRHKGLSFISVPLQVPVEARYAVTLRWRPDPANATSVLTEVFAQGAGNNLASSESDVGITESGDPIFFYDCGNDTSPYYELPSVFQFDEHSYVEISNRGTLEKVTVAGLELLEIGPERKELFIDSIEADGSEGWEKIDKIRFNAYNAKGEKLTDSNQQKGELSLKYRPGKYPERGWDPQAFYRVRIYYPGKRDQESRVPVVVQARRSTPVVRLSHPRLAKADATLILDAARTATRHEDALEYVWRQTAGPRVDLGEADLKNPQLQFVVPRPKVERAAWTALCGALLRHPDFLFTYPPSLPAGLSQEDRARLKLAKVALDLVGRPPIPEEFKELESGGSIASLVDHYLGSQEFRDFYFHRIRLYLESQATEVQDEPVRLWCYVAFEDRPFQEILTADYTVDADFQRRDRPSHHGRTGVLTTAGFIQGKPGLPHYNYAAQVSMLFLGYVYEVPPEIVEQREGVTALGTTDPSSVCFSCHKILTPLAFQRTNWTDDGLFRLKDEDDLEIDATDRDAVADYPFKGRGMEAFATQAVRKERFIRTMINTHVHFYFGRPMRHLEDERTLYKKLWDNVHENDFKLRELIRAIVTSPEYLREP